MRRDDKGRQTLSSLWYSYILAMPENLIFNLLWYTLLKVWNWIVKEMQIALGRQDTKGIFDALHKWFYLSCYPFPIKTVHTVIIPLKILLGLYCNTELMFCIFLNVTIKKRKKGKRKDLTRGTEIKCTSSIFLHFLGFKFFSNIYLCLWWE